MSARLLPSVLAAVTLSAACSSSSPSTPAAPPASATLPSGLDTAGMDTAVAPGDDFYAYANGSWMAATPIPADKASYGASSILIDQTRQQTVALIQDAGKGGPGASAESRKVADFYAAFMDEAGIEAKGLAPLKPALAPGPALPASWISVTVCWRVWSVRMLLAP